MPTSCCCVASRTCLRRAIRGLLKDEHGAWREEVGGADFINDVSRIIDEPTTPTVKVNKTTLNLLTKVAKDAASLLECNCGDSCDGSCTHNIAVMALTMVEKEASSRPPNHERGPSRVSRRCSHRPTTTSTTDRPVLRLVHDSYDATSGAL